ncbi:hypothetical protein FHS57_000701 [Runella defluvii]|uniref:Uncharacterized protein n=1 Tax=Runella defluvii TaxID=370973 RepID=A0A7W5ZIV9_9BACT|nr:hypothetical protein [Runella defluvii]
MNNYASGCYYLGVFFASETTHRVPDSASVLARADNSEASSLGRENKEARSLLIKGTSGDARAIGVRRTEIEQ